MAISAQNIQFNSISRFVEQVGARVVTKYGDLDQLTTIWNGPKSGALAFRPAVGSPHPQYPLMFATDSKIDYQAALVAKVEVTYQGIMNTNGKLPYRTPPILSTTAVQGSRDFETQWYTAISNVTTTEPTGFIQYPTYTYGTQKVNARYIGTQVRIHYNVYPEPNPGVPYFTSLGLGLVEVEIISQYFGEATALGTYTGPNFNIYTILPHIPQSTPPIRIMFLGMAITQKGLWFEVNEIYGPTF